jgi:hypothetical protein
MRSVIDSNMRSRKVGGAADGIRLHLQGILQRRPAGAMGALGGSGRRSRSGRGRIRSGFQRIVTASDVPLPSGSDQRKR